MEGLIQGPFAAALEAGRPRFNALFAQARRAMPPLDPEAFAAHLRETVAPVVDSVACAGPDQVPAVVEALFELSLELVGKNLPGRYPILAEGWRQLLSGLPEHLAASPRRLAGSITNALYQLSVVPQARPREWIERMRRLGPICPDPAALLEAGKVAAWRAGLAHFREGALETCRHLEPSLAFAALGVAEAGAPPLEGILQALRADPWLDPGSLGAAPQPRPLRIVARVGAFRGFGGEFLCPPQVALAAGQFFVADSESCWLLAADRFGATLHRAGTSLPSDRRAPPATFHIDRRGRVSARGQTAHFGELGDCTSFASDATTLAVTVPLSHVVSLVAFAE